MSGRFECGGRQRPIEIRFMEPYDPETEGRGVVAQPSEREFVGSREHDQRVGPRVPVADESGMSDREIERRVCRLTDLRGR